MAEKDGKQRSIGECECLYTDDKDNILVAIDTAIAMHEGVLQDIEKIRGFYEKSGIYPDKLVSANKELNARFAETRRKVAYAKLCDEKN